MAFSIDTAFSKLQRSVREGRLAHAYLITGPAGAGKADLVCRMVGELGGGRLESLETLESAPGVDKSLIHVVRPTSKSRQIVVDQIHRLEKFLQQASQRGTTRVGVVVDADRMGMEASNAFLKTLEEPPANSLLLLLSTQPETLLDTIHSRCLRIELMATARKAVEEGSAEAALLDLLQKHGVLAGRSVRDALVIASGVVAIFRDCKEAAKKEADVFLKAEKAKYATATDGSWLKTREAYYDALATANYLRKRSDLLELLITWFGDAMRQKENASNLDLTAYAGATAKLADHADTLELLRRMEAVERLREYFKTNVQENLAIEVCCLEAFS